MSEKKWEGGPYTKPKWDVFFMTQAFVVSQRSPDPRTVHGSILVSKDKRILSEGYNGPIKGSIDENINFNSDDKYAMLIHSEENCILNYHGSKTDLEGSTIYITGAPCHRCLRMILQKGISRIVYGPVRSVCIDEKDEAIKKEMLIGHNLKYEAFFDIEAVKNLLNKANAYIDYKMDFK